MTYCLPCTPGSYCQGTGNTAPTAPCDRGYYCPGGQDRAAPTEYNCTVGHFCEEGSPAPEPCVSGEYQDEEGSWECKTCPAE